jgi:TP901 family phage tail tape measure protein
MAKLNIDLTLNPNDFQKGLTATEKKVLDFSNSLGKDFDKAGENAGKGFAGGFLEEAKNAIKKNFDFASILNIASGVGAVNLISSAFSGIVSAGKEAIESFKQFDSAIANIATLEPQFQGSALSLDEFRDKINELSKKVPGDAADLANGVYQAISAGISGTVDEIVNFTEIANKTAVAGMASTEQAVNGITSVLNAYGLEAKDATGVSDTFFAAIKLGKTSFNELNGSLAQVIPGASSLGISFDQNAAALARLTAVGIPTAQAATTIKSAFTLLQKGTTPLNSALESIGTSLEEVREIAKKPVDEGGGLVNAFALIQKAADSTGQQLVELAGSTEAAAAIGSLAGTAERTAKSLQVYQGVVDEVAGGASEKAFQEASKSLENQIKFVESSIQAFFNNIFSALKPIAVSILQVVGPIVDGVNDFFKLLINSIQSLANQISSNFSPIIDSLSESFSTLFGESEFSFFDAFLDAVGVATSVITALVNIALIPLQIALSAVSGVVSIVSNNFETIKNIFSALSPIIAGITASVLAYITATKGVALAQELWNISKTKGLALITSLKTGIANLNIVQTLASVKAKIMAGAQWLLNAAMSANPIGLVVTAIGGLVAGFVLAYKNSETFRNFIDKIWTSFKNLLGTIGDAIKTVLQFLGILEKGSKQPPKVTIETEEAIKSVEAVNESIAETDQLLAKPPKDVKAKEIKSTFDSAKKSVEDFGKSFEKIQQQNYEIKLKFESDKIISELEESKRALDKLVFVDESERLKREIDIEKAISKQRFDLKEAEIKQAIIQDKNAEQLRSKEIIVNLQKQLKEQSITKSEFSRLEAEQLENLALIEFALDEKQKAKLLDAQLNFNNDVAKLDDKLATKRLDSQRKSFKEQQKLFDSILNEKFSLDYDLNFDLTGFLNKSNQLKSQNKDNQRDFEQTNRNLRQQLDKGEISYNEFANQLEIANEKIVDNTESTFSRIADTIANAFSRIKSSINIGVNAFDKYNEIQVRTGERERELRAILESSSADLLQRNNAQIEINKILAESENAKYAVFADVAGQMASLFGEQTIAYKAFAIAQASIATYLAATQALANPSLFPPLNVISASLITALGLANVAKIAGFKDGGFTAKVNANKEAEVFQTHGGEYVASNKVLRQDKIGFFKMLDKTRNLESALLFASDKLNVNSRPVQVINAGLERTKEQKVIVKLDNRQSFEHSIKSKIKGKDLEVLANKAKRAKLSRF